MRDNSVETFPKTEAPSPPPPPKRPRINSFADDDLPPGLTPRDTEILKLVIAGFDSTQVAEHLSTPLRNVEKYMHRLQRKVEDMNNPASPLLDLFMKRQ